VLFAVGVGLLAASTAYSAYDRYFNQGQSGLQALLGGAADATGISAVYAGITGRDLATQHHLRLTPAQQRQMLTEGSIQIGALVLPGILKAGGRLFAQGRAPVAPTTGLARNALEGGGFARGITAEEITAINRQLGGATTLTGDVSTVLANAARREGFWNKAATIVRDIAGRHMFNDANKRTTQAVVEELMRRNGITSGVSSDQMRRVIQQVASGELREVGDIARALRGF
jgi:hypothetical protein